MLVLTRRIGETIVVDGNVKVTVLRMHKGQVRLGIVAPPSVIITRPERGLPKTERPVAEPAVTEAVAV
jgi:carbon storage regulator